MLCKFALPFSNTVMFEQTQKLSPCLVVNVKICLYQLLPPAKPDIEWCSKKALILDRVTNWWGAIVHMVFKKISSSLNKLKCCIKHKSTTLTWGPLFMYQLLIDGHCLHTVKMAYFQKH